MKLPLPGKEVFNPREIVFSPAPEITDFVHHAFLNANNELFNPEHLHLKNADIGFLWTNVKNFTKGRRVLAMVEKGEPNGRPWHKARKEAQILKWFERIPAFIVIIDAEYFAQADDMQRCAILEHELYHIKQKLDEFGMPVFDKQTGMPRLEIGGHDVEEFIGVVKRYGAVSEELFRMKKALENAPALESSVVRGVCGTCLTKVA